MSISHIIKVFVCVGLIFTAATLTRGYSPIHINIKHALDSPEDTPASPQHPDIVVNGQKLAGPNCSALRRSGRLFLPLLCVARALGDVPVVIMISRTITVRRQTGILAEFDAKIGQVLENGSSILSVSNTAEIVFPPNTEELMLPIEILAALFDASIRLDDSTVSVSRGSSRAGTVATGAEHSFAEIYQVDYEYNLNRYSSALGQNLSLNASGRIADGRFNFVSGLTGSSMSRIQARSGTFTYERPDGQKYSIGDFGTGADLQFLSSYIRGAAAQITLGGERITAFGGRANSGFLVPQTELPVQDGVPRNDAGRNRFRFDTSIFGIYATTNSLASTRPRPFTFSAGVLRFSGSNRDGDLASGAVKYDDRRFRFQAEMGFGNFSGIQTDGVRTRGFASAVDISGSIQLRDNLSVQGRYTHIAAGFLSPQAGLREPIDLKAAGITWSPVKWLSASFNASTYTRPGDASPHNSFMTAAININPRIGLPSLFISHTMSSTPQAPHAAFTMFTASKEFGRFRLFANATRIKTIGAATMNGQIGGSFRVNESNTIEVSQGLGSHNMLNGQIDWRTSAFLNKRLSVGAGFGYTTNNHAAVSTFERLTASLALPRRSSLQLSYTQTNAGPTLMLSLRGSLFRKRESEAFIGASVSEAKSLGKIAGRVYQDVNLNGQYDPGVDHPQADVQVRVDGNRYVVTDINGLYRIDAVKSGQHQIYLDLLSVRADLTMLDGSNQNATLLAGRDSVVDFRLVRTGRISGIVWFDLNENGKLDNDEQPLADIRVVAGSGRDTMTDSNGFFTIGDLAPGEHAILIDEKTLPAKTRSGFKTLTVKVLAGHETGDTNFAVTAIPAEIKRFGSKQNN